jgi:hypothetical protein
MFLLVDLRSKRQKVDLSIKKRSCVSATSVGCKCLGSLDGFALVVKGKVVKDDGQDGSWQMRNVWLLGFGGIIATIGRMVWNDNFHLGR